MGTEAPSGTAEAVDGPIRQVKRVRMSWTGEGLVFRGGTPGAPEVLVDGDSGAGPSPMDTLLVALASCMGSDVRHILEKARVPVEVLEVDVQGTRAATNPRRYQEIRLTYRVRGPGEEHASRLDRAVQLSRDTYCSVLHSLRPDIDVEIGIERV
jgi:putative redox protein